MNYAESRKLKDKSYFTVEDLEDLLKIKRESSRVLCSRYANNGFFVRLKRNLYVLNEKWESFGREDLLRAANFLQIPSYISFMTALSFYGVTTQVQRDFLESASLKRSVKTNIKGKIFNYYKLKKQLYSDFVKKDNIFIAAKEKAFVDAVYLYSFGKYKFDLDSLDLGKLDKDKLKRILKVFPSKTRAIVKKLCRI